MKRIHQLLATVFLVTASAAHAGVPVPLTQDTHVREAQPNANFSTHASLFVYENAARYALLQFDTTGISGTVTSATLSLQLTSLPTQGSFEVRRLLSAWDENTVTFSTTPSAGAQLDGSGSLIPNNVGTTINIDVTAAVAGWVEDGNSNFGLVIKATNNLRAKFAANAATLDVVTDNVTANPGDVLAWDGNNFVATPPANVINGSGVDKRQPYLALNYIIALQGIFPSQNGANPFIGEIILFSGTFAPAGWAFCDGQTLLIANNTALFSIIGTTYGGDGESTFALPDLRGRAAVHRNSNGAGGLSIYNLGQQGGSEFH